MDKDSGYPYTLRECRAEHKEAALFAKRYGCGYAHTNDSGEDEVKHMAFHKAWPNKPQVRR